MNFDLQLSSFLFPFAFFTPMGRCVEQSSTCSSFVFSKNDDRPGDADVGDSRARESDCDDTNSLFYPQKYGVAMLWSSPIFSISLKIGYTWSNLNPLL